MAASLESIPLQATIGGMGAANADGFTLYGELDLASGLLLIDMAEVVRPGLLVPRRTGCAVLTNDAAADDYDNLFTEQDLRDSISDYFNFAGRSLLMLEDPVSRFNPSSKIEADGIDERGRKFRVAPDINNGQIAVMAMCWFASRQSGVAAQLATFDDYSSMLVTTVGLGRSVARRPGSTPQTIMGGKVAIGPDGWPI
jgi:hypothetical protein